MLRSLFVLISLISFANAQTPYRVVMPREDGVSIVYNMVVSSEKGKPVWTIRNAAEKLRVDSIRKTSDSLLIDMPFFDSRMSVSVGNDQVLKGFWYKGTTTADLVMPVIATPGISWRFEPILGNAAVNISGRYSVDFIRT